MNNLKENAFDEYQSLRNKINISIRVCEKVLDDFSNLVFAEVIKFNLKLK